MAQLYTIQWYGIDSEYLQTLKAIVIVLYSHVYWIYHNILLLKGFKFTKFLLVSKYALLNLLSVIHPSFIIRLSLSD